MTLKPYHCLSYAEQKENGLIREGSYHIKSRIKSARGIISAFPIIPSNIEKADKPLMLSGYRKFVHYTSIINFSHREIYQGIKLKHTNNTICETGIHMKRRVAVHPDSAPTTLMPFSVSLPILACKS